ncbi:MAG: hypothetical protein Q7U71_09605 [bacterium]|nr:hypothetical protein [bacterium]
MALFTINKPLAGVPGPSPWYYKEGSVLNKTRYRWEHEQSQTLAGITKLRNENGKIVLVLGLYCYLQKIYNSIYLIWYRSNPGNNTSPETIQFILLDFTKLTEISNYEEIAHNLTIKHINFGVNSNDCIVSEFSIRILSEGRHTLSAPKPFTQIKEVLVISDYLSQNEKERTHTAIYSFKFKTGVVEVYPQDWFNTNDYDIGYQWITQVKRRIDGRICGRGIRIPPFVLDKTSRLKKRSFLPKIV